ncbi:MAG TPA: hypothetical protein PLD84_10625, partial [Chitinophagales bacterium]|nr:hypothetical protein [Chitinophagales bacterium]
MHPKKTSPSDTADAIYYGGDIITVEWNRPLHEPLNTAFKMGLPGTNHINLNVLPIDQMMLICTGVNRTTRTVVLLGADEKSYSLPGFTSYYYQWAHHPY